MRDTKVPIHPCRFQFNLKIPTVLTSATHIYILFPGIDTKHKQQFHEDCMTISHRCLISNIYNKYLYVLAFMYMCIHICTHICIFIHSNTYMCLYICIDTNTDIKVWVYTNTYTHTQKHINIYTSICPSNQKHLSGSAFLTTLNDIEFDTESDSRGMELQWVTWIGSGFSGVASLIWLRTLILFPVVSRTLAITVAI